MLQHATLPEISYSSPEVLDFLCAYYDRASRDSIRDRVEGGTLSILECTSCRLIYQREIPDDDFMRAIYSDWIVQDDFLSPTAKPQTVEHYSYLASEVLHLLAEQRRIIGAERRIRVLDYGMGWSAWLQMARSFGAVVSGVELSDPKVEYARSIGIPVLSSAEIAAMQFDIICTEQVFEHVAHPAPLLELLVSALAPTGFLKISVPEGHSAKKVLSGWKWSKAIARKNEFLPVHPLEHINCFRTDSLDRFAARFGLERARVSPLRAAALSSGWHSAISTAKNLLRPMYRFGLRRGTYAIYRRREERAE
jgi:2-polyprenyl-3-methyl-5-hydroxy-6-metoxy-1,4-benzoquinol methylase